MKKEYLTIQEEMKKRGINQECFDTLYSELKERNKLPSGDVVPWIQYKKIVNYLRTKEVLTEDNQIQKEGMELFDLTMTLEKRIEYIEQRSKTREPSGGFMPCRSSSRSSGGGLAPCRY